MDFNSKNEATDEDSVSKNHKYINKIEVNTNNLQVGDYLKEEKHEKNIRCVDKHSENTEDIFTEDRLELETTDEATNNEKNEEEEESYLVSKAEMPHEAITSEREVQEILDEIDYETEDHAGEKQFNVKFIENTVQCKNYKEITKNNCDQRVFQTSDPDKLLEVRNTIDKIFTLKKKDNVVPSRINIEVPSSNNRDEKLHTDQTFDKNEDWITIEIGIPISNDLREYQHESEDEREQYKLLNTVEEITILENNIEDDKKENTAFDIKVSSKILEASTPLTSCEEIVQNINQIVYYENIKEENNAVIDINASTLVGSSEDHDQDKLNYENEEENIGLPIKVSSEINIEISTSADSNEAQLTNLKPWIMDCMDYVKEEDDVILNSEVSEFNIETSKRGSNEAQHETDPKIQQKIAVSEIKIKEDEEEDIANASLEKQSEKNNVMPFRFEIETQTDASVERNVQNTEDVRRNYKIEEDVSDVTEVPYEVQIEARTSDVSIERNVQNTENVRRNYKIEEDAWYDREMLYGVQIETRTSDASIERHQNIRAVRSNYETEEDLGFRGWNNTGVRLEAGTSKASIERHGQNIGAVRINYEREEDLADDMAPYGIRNEEITSDEELDLQNIGVRIIYEGEEDVWDNTDVPNGVRIETSTSNASIERHVQNIEPVRKNYKRVEDKGDDMEVLNGVQGEAIERHIQNIGRRNHEREEGTWEDTEVSNGVQLKVRNLASTERYIQNIGAVRRNDEGKDNSTGNIVPHGISIEERTSDASNEELHIQNTGVRTNYKAGVDAVNEMDGFRIVASRMHEVQNEEEEIANYATEEKNSTDIGHGIAIEETTSSDSNVKDGWGVDENEGDEISVTQNEARNTDDSITTCMQCKRVKHCKYKLKFYGVNYICKEQCFLAFINYVKPIDIIKQMSAFSTDTKDDVRKCVKCLKIISKEMSWLSWQTMDYCHEDCLRKYYQEHFSRCSICSCTQSTIDSIGKYWTRFGHKIHQCCSSKCLNKLRKIEQLCKCCENDITNLDHRVPNVFFCSMFCYSKYTGTKDKEQVIYRLCSICTIRKLDMKIVLLQQAIDKNSFGKIEDFFCSKGCFIVFKYLNKLHPLFCETCKKFFIPEKNIKLSIYRTYLGTKHFCSTTCQNVHIIANRKLVSCMKCKIKKYNFDMISQRNNSHVHFVCSLNCLQFKKNTIPVNYVNCGTTHEPEPLKGILLRSPSFENLCSQKSKEQTPTIRQEFVESLIPNTPELTRPSNNQNLPKSDTPLSSSAKNIILRSGTTFKHIVPYNQTPAIKQKFVEASTPETSILNPSEFPKSLKDPNLLKSNTSPPSKNISSTKNIILTSGTTFRHPQKYIMPSKQPPACKQKFVEALTPETSTPNLSELCRPLNDQNLSKSDSPLSFNNISSTPRSEMFSKKCFVLIKQTPAFNQKVAEAATPKTSIPNRSELSRSLNDPELPKSDAVLRSDTSLQQMCSKKCFVLIKQTPAINKKFAEASMPKTSMPNPSKLSSLLNYQELPKSVTVLRSDTSLQQMCSKKSFVLTKQTPTINQKFAEASTPETSRNYFEPPRPLYDTNLPKTLSSKNLSSTKNIILKSDPTFGQCPQKCIVPKKPQKIAETSTPETSPPNPFELPPVNDLNIPKSSTPLLSKNTSSTNTNNQMMTKTPLMKNQTSNCKSTTRDVLILTKPSQENKSTQTDKFKPKFGILTVPVPIYVPLPTNMFIKTSPTFFPHPVPIPVPVFLDTNCDSAEKIIEKIQEIRNCDSETEGLKNDFELESSEAMEIDFDNSNTTSDVQLNGYGGFKMESFSEAMEIDFDNFNAMSDVQLNGYDFDVEAFLTVNRIHKYEKDVSSFTSNEANGCCDSLMENLQMIPAEEGTIYICENSLNTSLTNTVRNSGSWNGSDICTVGVSQTIAVETNEMSPVYSNWYDFLLDNRNDVLGISPKKNDGSLIENLQTITSKKRKASGTILSSENSLKTSLRRVQTDTIRGSGIPTVVEHRASQSDTNTLRLAQTKAVRGSGSGNEISSVSSNWYDFLLVDNVYKYENGVLGLSPNKTDGSCKDMMENSQTLTTKKRKAGTVLISEHSLKIPLKPQTDTVHAGGMSAVVGLHDSPQTNVETQLRPPQTEAVRGIYGIMEHNAFPQTDAKTPLRPAQNEAVRAICAVAGFHASPQTNVKTLLRPPQLTETVRGICAVVGHHASPQTDTKTQLRLVQTEAVRGTCAVVGHQASPQINVNKPLRHVQNEAVRGICAVAECHASPQTSVKAPLKHSQTEAAYGIYTVVEHQASPQTNVKTQLRSAQNEAVRGIAAGCHASPQIDVKTSLRPAQTEAARGICAVVGHQASPQTNMKMPLRPAQNEAVRGICAVAECHASPQIDVKTSLRPSQTEAARGICAVVGHQTSPQINVKTPLIPAQNEAVRGICGLVKHHDFPQINPKTQLRPLQPESVRGICGVMGSHALPQTDEKFPLRPAQTETVRGTSSEVSPVGSNWYDFLLNNVFKHENGVLAFTPNKKNGSCTGWKENLQTSTAKKRKTPGTTFISEKPLKTPLRPQTEELRGSDKGSRRDNGRGNGKVSGRRSGTGSSNCAVAAHHGSPQTNAVQTIQLSPSLRPQTEEVRGSNKGSGRDNGRGNGKGNSSGSGPGSSNCAVATHHGSPQTNAVQTTQLSPSFRPKTEEVRGEGKGSGSGSGSGNYAVAAHHGSPQTSAIQTTQLSSPSRPQTEEVRGSDRDSGRHNGRGSGKDSGRGSGSDNGNRAVAVHHGSQTNAVQTTQLSQVFSNWDGFVFDNVYSTLNTDRMWFLYSLNVLHKNP